MIFTERLLVNGSPVAIAGYSVVCPKDGMGQSVTIALAKPDVNSVPLDAEISFEIGASLWNGTTYDTSYAPPIIEGGKLNGRSYTVKWLPDERGGLPGDVIEFSSLSPLADKWSVSPDLPVILFDPRLVDEDGFKFRDQDLIKEYGSFPGGFRYLRPELEPIQDLKLWRVLDRIYKEGCGFDRIITNLPNPPIDRVDISIEAGYHAAAVPLINRVGLNLLSFEHENILYILDPARGLTSGMPVQEIGLDCVVEVNQNISPEVLSNAIILTYKADPGVIYAGERIEEKIIELDEVENGSGVSYTKQDGYRRISEFYDINSNELRRTEEHEIVTRIYGYADNVELVITGEGTPEEVITRTRIPGSVRLLSRETITNRYTGNTKAGHTRTVEGYFTNPETRGLPEFREILREENVSTWTVDLNHPGESVLKRSVTTTSGICLKELLGDGYLCYTPIQEADAAGIIKSDQTQTLETRDIETEIEELVETGVNQSNVETRIIDHLYGRPRKAGVQGRPGSRSTFFPNFALPLAKNGYIRELIKDEASVALYGLRKPQPLDVDRLGAVDGRELARRKLAYMVSPPKSITITLPGILFHIHRGSVVLPPARVFSTGLGTLETNKHVVESFTISASGIGSEQARRIMRLECLEVKNAGA